MSTLAPSTRCAGTRPSVGTRTPARWLVTARRGGSCRRYLLYQSVDFNQARRAKADAQLWLGAWRPDHLWLVTLHTLAEGR